jgi:hypothetical protein
MIAFSRYRKNPCQLKAENAFTSHNTPLMARTQPNARIEKVLPYPEAVCQLENRIHLGPRCI